MKETVRPVRPEAAQTPSTSELKSTSPMSRIALALLEEYTLAEEPRGYDPYNSYAPDRASLAWQRKSKRA